MRDFCGASAVGACGAVSEEATGELLEERHTCWRSADLNAGHNPSSLGWNAGRCCLANLWRVCERVDRHTLRLKNVLEHMCLTWTPRLLLSFPSRRVPCAPCGCKLPADTHQTGYFLSLKFCHQMQDLLSHKKCVGN